MKDFQHILEECLTRLSNGTASMDECLARYPQHAEQLKPLLQTALLLNHGSEVMPSPTFNAYTRSAVIQYIRSHPRQPQRVMPLFQRAALTFAVLVAALLVTGTVHAQSAMPGDFYYGWKRTSESVWRALSLDQVSVDIFLAERRLNEWIAVANDSARSTSAMNSYQDAISRLESANGVKTLTLIVPALQSQQQALNDAGLSNSELNDYLIKAVNSIPTAASTQVPPTNVPPTNVPPTNVPPTNIPPTDIPPTDIPPTDIPPTDIPPTDIPPTDIPPTDIPPTDIPPTDIPITEVPTQLPEPTPTN